MDPHLECHLGDILRLKVSIHPHGEKGDLFTVVGVRSDRGIIINWCRCANSDSHHLEFIIFPDKETYEVVGTSLSPEDREAKLNEMPSIEDVDDFFKREQ